MGDRNPTLKTVLVDTCVLINGRVLGTQDIFLFAVRSRILSVADADTAKATLERNRFRMGFRSFADLIGENESRV